MRNFMLTAGTALALSASPAFAGGARLGPGAGLFGSMHGFRGDAAAGRAQRSTSSAGDCLCKAVGTALGNSRSVQGITRMPRTAAGVAGLTNSVIGLGGVGNAHAGHHQASPAIGLAGVVIGNGVGAIGGRSGHQGIGLAGTVVASVGASSGGLLAGTHAAKGHRDSAVNVSILNRTAGRAGYVANVAVLNGKEPAGRSAISVEALNGAAGHSGHYDSGGQRAASHTANHTVDRSAHHGNVAQGPAGERASVRADRSGNHDHVGQTRSADRAGRTAGHSSSAGNATAASWGRSAVTVSALNRKAERSGRLATVAVLNAKGPAGRSAITIAALNGTRGTAGSLVNVQALNGGRSKNTHSNGTAGGVRLINGVPCLADGTPLTGAAAAAALVSLGVR